MTFHGLSGHILNLIGGLAQKLFGRRRDGYVVALYLNLSYSVYAHRHAFAGVHLGGLAVDRQQFQREDVHLFQDGQDENTAACPDLEADLARGAVRIDDAMLAAGNEQHLVWAPLHVAVGPNGDKGKKYEQNGAYCPNDRWGGECGNDNWNLHNFQVLECSPQFKIST